VPLPVKEASLALKPKGLTMEEAASIPLVALTAWQAPVEKANLQKGQKVFIQAGSGGVGTFAIQLDKHLDATVATTWQSHSDFYRQTRFEIAQKPINERVFRAPVRRAGQFIGFFAKSDVDCARLIRCWREFQQYAIAQIPRVVAYRLPKFAKALRGFLSLAVTKVHIR
jgi:D-arabinose 1-dehydrogenase-like Zn-dependent alcohol dehydrogenase